MLTFWVKLDSESVLGQFYMWSLPNRCDFVCLWCLFLCSSFFLAWLFLFLLVAASGMVIWRSWPLCEGKKSKWYLGRRLAENPTWKLSWCVRHVLESNKDMINKRKINTTKDNNSYTVFYKSCDVKIDMSEYLTIKTLNRRPQFLKLILVIYLYGEKCCHITWCQKLRRYWYKMVKLPLP